MNWSHLWVGLIIAAFSLESREKPVLLLSVVFCVGGVLKNTPTIGLFSRLRISVFDGFMISYPCESIIFAKDTVLYNNNTEYKKEQYFYKKRKEGAAIAQ